jgi:hypothetical protein
MNEKGVYIEEVSEICEVSVMNPTTQTFCFEVKYALKNFFHQHPFYSIKEYSEQGNPVRGGFE